MTDVILREKEIRGSDGKLIGTSRIVVNEKTMEIVFKDLGIGATTEQKTAKLKKAGYSDSDIEKMKQAKLL